ncbi:MAG: NAD(P)H-dependent oxidoreductase [Xanthomonadales bacterium]|nr:NAD(P)H-dependent oxidoreductase [Xanthomonadales bacterium]
MSLKLNVIVGSTRPGRRGLAVAQWLAEHAASLGSFQVELVDLADFNLPLLDEAAHPAMQRYEHEHTKRWAASVAAADAYVFVTPEYNYFPPASLVNALQVVMGEWNRKVAGVLSYGGISGGLRAAQQLRLLIASTNMHSLPQVVPVPNVPALIDDAGKFNPVAATVDGSTAMLNELHAWAGALKTLRNPS